MMGSSFSPRLIGVAVRQRDWQHFLADFVAVTVTGPFVPATLSYPVPRRSAGPRVLRVEREAIAR